MPRPPPCEDGVARHRPLGAGRVRGCASDDELARDPATAAFIAAHTPPFFIVRLHPWSRVYTAVSDYLRNYGRDRFAAGERGVLVMVDAGDWITFNREPNRYLAIAGPGCVDLIRAHLEGSDR